MQDASIPIRLDGLSVGYAGCLIGQLTLAVRPGEILSIVGSSGTGKSTLLKTIAGLLLPLEGSVTVFGEPPTNHYGKNRFHYLHQDPVLFPHLDVRQNVSVVGKLIEGALDEEGVEGALRKVGLLDKAAAYPRQLSRGMKARLALARLFAAPPGLILADEPFASLDIMRRQELTDLFNQLCGSAGTTLVNVTHDIVEAVRSSDHILALRAGEWKLFDCTGCPPSGDPNALDARSLDARDQIRQFVQEGGL